MNLNLDRYELLFLIESTAKGIYPNQNIWRTLVDNLFHQMDPYDIRFLRLHSVDNLCNFYSTDKSEGFLDFHKFLARYDINNNLYEISCCKSGKPHIIYGFLFREKFYVSMDMFINPELINRYEKVDMENLDDIGIHDLIWEAYWAYSYGVDKKFLCHE